VEGTAHSFRSGLILTLGVVLTLFIALTLAITDTLQVRLPPPPTPAPVEAIAVATIATAETPPTPPPLPTATTTEPPPTRALPTTTPTPTMTRTPRTSPTPTPAEVVRKCTVAPPGWIEYTVENGDTLSRLAVDSGASVSAVSAANCLENNRIYPGMVLFLPAEPPPPAPICTGPPPSWERYTLQRGDTLFSLARSRGVTLHGLMTANCLVETRILAGQVVYVPPLAATATATPTEEPPPPPPPPTEPPPPPPTEPPPAETLEPPVKTLEPPADTPTPPASEETLTPEP
jgi:LysM repeat protein